MIDMDAPFIIAEIGGQKLRLRVDPAAQDVIQLNPDAAARTGIALPDRLEAVVGRIEVQGRSGPAQVHILGRRMQAHVATHDKRCCDDADGEIAPMLLPFDVVRFVRATQSAPGMARRFPLQASGESGQYVRVRTAGGTLFARFTLRWPETVATAASGSMLARAGGGRFEGPGLMTAQAFGIARPARMMRLARPVDITGFAIDHAIVRQADFRGQNRLPSDKPRADDIAVRGRAASPQSAWPALTIGRDRLDRCDRIEIRRMPPEIILSCRS
ncbi:hypothetical protein ABC347_15440 [Sphingomonas sp. 1P06PA]|uniref:hypothetical protein n=1 Tax=Sphingomonas sp. 1P06PA TaxID=554121 RepID=UPI0039A5CF05